MQICIGGVLHKSWWLLNGGNMKKFIVYLLVIIVTVSLGFAVFYLVRDNEIISISSASMYKDVGDNFTLDVSHMNKKKSTTINVTSSDDGVVSGSYNSNSGQYNAVANKGGVARINVRTTNAKFRNLWCDVIVGDGTVESPFYISTAEQLSAIGMGVKIGTDENGNDIYAGAEGYEKYASNLCYKLVANIDASTVNDGYWVPLRNFTGRFDGNGLTISKVYIDAVGYNTAFGDKADSHFTTNCKAGLFESIGAGSAVYNFKLENFMAVGTYSTFGVIAAENYGIIERIEVKDAVTSISTGLFGGLVGLNETTETPIYSEDKTTIVDYERNIARIDRCSINLTHGSLTNNNGGVSIVSNGIIGGLVGENLGGTLVYSYVRGNVYFGDNVSAITYGGVVAKNTAKQGLHYNVEYADESEFQGAHIKDCYSDLKANFAISPSASHNLAGAIAINTDYNNGLIDNVDNIANNYIIGVYYNKDNIKYDGVTFKGINEFLLDGKIVTFDDKVTIAYGLTSDEMKNADKFISHVTKAIEFNEDGTSKGLVTKNILWLFDTVWTIDENGEVNGGMPYLNYQLVYIPDDFYTVGTPVVVKDLNAYEYRIEIDYPVSILSGVDGTLRITIGEFYQLQYSPMGIDLTWSSSNSNIVSVDSFGQIQGLSVGVATITATTKSGSTDTITVIVDNFAYTLENVPAILNMYVGDTYSLDAITVTPTPVNGDTLSYSSADATIASVTSTTGIITAKQVGTTTIYVTIGDTKVAINVNVTLSSDSLLTLNASETTISGYYESISKTGTITITNTDNADVSYTCDNTSGFVTTYFGTGSNKNILYYTITGTGSAVVRVNVNTTGFGGYVDIYFNIKSETSVNLTLSSTMITGCLEDMAQTGYVTISNSANASLSYKAESDNTSVVTVSVTGNSMKYTLQGYGIATVIISVDNDYYTGTAYVVFYIYENSGSGSVDVQYVNLNTYSATLYIGDTFTLQATGNFSTLTWSSSNTSVATVNNGVISAKSAGTAVITVTTDGGVEAKCSVTVKNNQGVASISVTPTSVNLYQGATKQLSASGSGYSAVNWKSSNTTIATVNISGLVTASSSQTGTVTITAQAVDANGNVKATATSSITVVAQPLTISLSINSTSIVKGNNAVITATLSRSLTSGETLTWSSTTDDSAESVSGTTLTIDTNNSKVTLGSYYVTASVGSASANISFTVQENTTYNKYIYNLTQLNAIRYNLDKDYVLSASFSVGDWTPIGTYSAPFTGTITTAGNAVFTLSNVNATANDYCGLFGYTKNARIENVKISNSTFNGSGAGAVVGNAYNTTISGCSVVNSTITGKQYAGGIVGYIWGNNILSYNTVSNTTIIASTSVCYVGGIVGKSYNASVEECTVSGNLTASGIGYVGGIVGYTNAGIKSCLSTAVVSGLTTADTNYAGGLVGYTSSTIKTSTVKNATITGYNVGGLAGSVNISSTITLKFSEYKSGYRMEDLSNYSYVVSINENAVKNSVTVKGVVVGGLIGVLNSGVVSNCYTRATLQGVTIGSRVAGLACDINASGFDNYGGTGQAGLILYSYSATTFGGSGTKYAITSSLVHNHTANNMSRSSGYVMNYVFDKDLADGAEYDAGNNFLTKDKVQAKKSTSEMKTSSTYTAKGFSTSYWNLSSGYPTLKSEK